MRVFLGGTVNNSDWRDKLIELLEIDYFNPIVEDWDTESQLVELQERKNCDYILYVLTPKMDGFYSIAEVTDDSFKRPDHTILCYLEEDDGLRFSEPYLRSLEILREKVEGNGALFLDSLESVATYLNAGKQTRPPKDLLLGEGEFFDIFISYGRRHSLSFVRELHESLNEKGYKVWFDMENIPLAVDYQSQINEGIRKANNFIFVISPHSIKSEYCAKEVALAKQYNKRIIPILHVPGPDMENTMDPLIQKLNWLYFDDQGKYVASLKNLFSTIENLKDEVATHTLILDEAYNWDTNQRLEKWLLKGKKLIDARTWLTEEQKPEVAAVIQPADLHCEFITESIKFANQLTTSVFISYAREDLEFRKYIQISLARNMYTCWVDNRDIQSGHHFNDSIKLGIENAENIIFIISSRSIVSEYCLLELQYAIENNKRILPVLIEEIDNVRLPDVLASYQYISFLNTFTLSENDDNGFNVYEKEFGEAFDILLKELQWDKDYFTLHAEYLAFAYGWKRKAYPDSFLLKGERQLEAEDWLKIGINRDEYQPLQLHEQFINEGIKKRAALKTEVFLAYDPQNEDFANRIFLNLQKLNRITWFDQKWIRDKKDRKNILRHAVLNSINVVFIVSHESLVSCKDQIELATANSKRIIRALAPNTSLKTLPNEELLNHDHIFVDKDFSNGIRDLINHLDADRDYLASLDKWSAKAMEWENQKKDNGLLLQKTECAVASDWYQRAVNDHKSPPPSDAVVEFINSSSNEIQLQEKRAKRIALILRMFTVAISILFVAACIETYTAIKNKKRMEKATKGRLVEMRKRVEADSLAKASSDELVKEAHMRIVADSMASAARQRSLASKKLALEAQKQSLINYKAKLKADSASRVDKLMREQAENAKRSEEEKLKRHKALNYANYLVSTGSGLLSEDDDKDAVDSVVRAIQIFGKNLDPPINDYIQGNIQEFYTRLSKNEFRQSQTNPVYALEKVSHTNMVISGDDQGIINLWKVGGIDEKLIASENLSKETKRDFRIREITPYDKGHSFLVRDSWGDLVKLSLKKDKFDPSLSDPDSISISKVNSMYVYDSKNGKEFIYIVGPDGIYNITDKSADRPGKIYSQKGIRFLTGGPIDNSLITVTSDDQLHYLQIDPEQQKILAEKKTNWLNKINDLLAVIPGRISSIASTTSGTMIAIGKQSGHVVIFKIFGNGSVKEISHNYGTKHLSEVTKTKFNAAGKELISTGRDGQIIVWYIDHDDLYPEKFNIDQRDIYGLCMLNSSRFLVGTDVGKISSFYTNMISIKNWFITQQTR